MCCSGCNVGLLNSRWRGDTIRVSLAAEPEEEVRVGFEILKSLGLRHRGVNLIACPSCARQKFNVIQTVQELEKRVAHIHENIDVAVIGCVVNGPGEAKEAEVGVTGGYPVHMLYRDGEKSYCWQAYCRKCEMRINSGDSRGSLTHPVSSHPDDIFSWHAHGGCRKVSQ